MIISSSIFSNPFLGGKPLVLFTNISVSFNPTAEVNVVYPDIASGVRLSSFKYKSKFSAISAGPPGKSCER